MLAIQTPETEILAKNSQRWWLEIATLFIVIQCRVANTFLEEVYVRYFCTMIFLLLTVFVPEELAWSGLPFVIGACMEISYRNARQTGEITGMLRKNTWWIFSWEIIHYEAKTKTLSVRLLSCPYLSYLPVRTRQLMSMSASIRLWREVNFCSILQGLGKSLEKSSYGARLHALSTKHSKSVTRVLRGY